MGTAFVAVADDPSAVAYNPAGLTQLKATNLYGGGTAILPANTYESPSGRTEQTASQVFLPFYLYGCSDLGTRDFRVGVGLFPPFGIGGRKWSDTGLTRYASVESTTGTLGFNPTVAYKVTSNFSIAAGVNYMISKVETKTMVDQSALGARDGEVRLQGDGDGWGYNAGVLYTPVPQWSFGLAYRSDIEVNYTGQLRYSQVAPALQPLLGGSVFVSDIRTSQHFPKSVGFGSAYRPTSAWTLTLEAEWIGWSTFDRSIVELERKVPAAGLTSRVTRFDWQDAWAFKIGVEYKINGNLALRGGYLYAQSPVPDQTLDPANPDSNQHDVSLGIGYNRGRYLVDFFAIAAFFEKRTVQNEILNGTYQSSIHYLFGISLGVKF